MSTFLYLELHIVIVTNYFEFHQRVQIVSQNWFSFLIKFSSVFHLSHREIIQLVTLHSRIPQQVSHCSVCWDLLFFIISSINTILELICSSLNDNNTWNFHFTCKVLLTYTNWRGKMSSSNLSSELAETSGPLTEPFIVWSMVRCDCHGRLAAKRTFVIYGNKASEPSILQQLVLWPHSLKYGALI